MKINFRNMFNSIFKGKEQNIITENFKLLNGYENVFTPFDDNAYDDDTVRTCVDCIAKHCAKLKPKHIRKKAGKIQEQINDSLDYLLANRPNEYLSTYDFIYKIISQLFSYNNAFIYIKFNKWGYVEGLYPLNFGELELKQYKNELFCKFTFNGGESVFVPYNELIHLKRHFNRHEIFGESNQTLKNSLDILRHVKMALKSAVINCFKLWGILKFNQVLRDEDLMKAYDTFINSFMNTSSKKVSGIGALDAKTDFKELTSDIKTVDSTQMSFAREDIYRYFGLSEKIITSTYNEEEYIAFYESVIEPIAIQMGLEFTEKLLTKGERNHGNEIIFESNRLQYASTNSKIRICQALLPQGIITINEARDLFGYSGIEGGDERQISLNFVNANHQALYQLGKDLDINKKGDDKDE